MYNNISSLERLHNKQMRIPCIGPVDPQGTDPMPNEYDMIWLPNFRQHLGSKMWMWLLPINEEMKGQGFFYPKIPEITMSDLNILLKDASKVHNTSFTVNDFEHDPRDYIEKALNKYSGNTFLIRGGPEEEDKEVFVAKEEVINGNWSFNLDECYIIMLICRYFNIYFA